MASINVKKELKDEEVYLQVQEKEAIEKVKLKLQDNIIDAEHNIENLRDSAKDIYS